MSSKPASCVCVCVSVCVYFSPSPWAASQTCNKKNQQQKQMFISKPAVGRRRGIYSEREIIWGAFFRASVHAAINRSQRFSSFSPFSIAALCMKCSATSGIFHQGKKWVGLNLQRGKDSCWNNDRVRLSSAQCLPLIILTHWVTLISLALAVLSETCFVCSTHPARCTQV